MNRRAGSASARPACRWAAYALILLWAATYGILCASPAFLPDEVWFLGIALRTARAASLEQDWPRRLLFHPNDLGYGGVWWSLYALYAGLCDSWAHYFSQHADQAGGLDRLKVAFTAMAPEFRAPLYLMRGTAIAVLGLFYLKAIGTARAGAAALIGALCVLSMPLSWWSGKLASPELLSAACMALAAHAWFLERKAWSGLILLSLSMAMKLTALPCGLVLAGFILWSLRARWRNIGFGIILCAAIFLLGNLYLLTHPFEAMFTLSDLKESGKPFDPLRNQMRQLLTGGAMTWDGTPIGSVSRWLGSGAAPCALGLIALWLMAVRRHRDLVLFLLLAFAATFLFLLPQVPHGWYWFPFILPASLLFFRLDGAPWPLCALAVALMLPGLLQVRREIGYRADHARELSEIALQEDCIAAALADQAPARLLDLGTVGHVTPARGATQIIDFQTSWALFWPEGQGMKPDDAILAGAQALRFHRRLRLARDQARKDGMPVAECGRFTLFRFSSIPTE